MISCTRPDQRPVGFARLAEFIILAALAVMMLISGAGGAQAQRPGTQTSHPPANPRSDVAPGTAKAKDAKSVDNRRPEAANDAIVDTLAREALLIDITSGAVLFEKNSHQQMAPSSMSKLMTMYIVFEKLKSGQISLEDRLPVSDRAWRTQGSKMFVELGGQISVGDLIRGVIIQSGNDASVVLAEGISGSEESFAVLMNKKATELGMFSSNFTNPHGLPDDNHYMTAQDLAILGRRVISDFPDYFKLYSVREFTYHGIKQGNRNPLLYRVAGADGLKTGHTNAAGYGLVGTVERQGRRLLLVLNGLPSVQSRSDEASRIIEWGFREFSLVSLFQPGDLIDRVPVWLGELDSVPVTVAQPAVLTLGRTARAGLQVKLLTDGMVPAPIAAGMPVGRLVATAPGAPAYEVPVVAAAAVDRLGIWWRMAEAARYVLLGNKN